MVAGSKPPRPPAVGRPFNLAMIATAKDGMLLVSELQALRWSGIEPAEDGLVRLTIRKSKTDQ